MSRRELVREFARLAIENARKSRASRKRRQWKDAEWFAGRSGAYLTAARILRGVV